ncbi:hypothetical protein [Xanthobacter tagetidis]|uniref:hypothetical protein n=1 Tax=Xanthobacter tagetidis TaxID=60216 RepID=UPI0011C46735|nr:hypothetical protein [Xanthobacter tagetidis]MBB6308937.1 hypothetical protein [Xanthobacter tagetidis]
MIALADPTFIVAAIAALAAAASAWISWRVLRQQERHASEMFVVNVRITRSNGLWILAFEAKNLSPYRWQAKSLEILSPRGAGVHQSWDDIPGRNAWHPPTCEADRKTLVAKCRMRMEIAPAGMEQTFQGAKFRMDHHWESASLYLESQDEITLSMRLTFSSMDARQKVEVVHVTRTLPATKAIATP